MMKRALMLLLAMSCGPVVVADNMIALVMQEKPGELLVVGVTEVDAGAVVNVRGLGKLSFERNQMIPTKAFEELLEKYQSLPERFRFTPDENTNMADPKYVIITRRTDRHTQVHRVELTAEHRSLPLLSALLAYIQTESSPSGSQ